MAEQFPTELWARVFEIGIETWGINFLPSLCCVNKSWNVVVETTPRLWGIITINKSSNCRKIELQVSRAKASPLIISVHPRAVLRHIKPALGQLASLSENWVRVDVPIEVLALAKWTDLRGHLENLALWGDSASADLFFTHDGADDFTSPKLHSFTGKKVSEPWITGFLGPNITYFELSRVELKSPVSIFHILSLIPNVGTLRLSGVFWSDRSPSPGQPQTVYLTNLLNLEFDSGHALTYILCHLRAPSLRYLAIDKTSWRDRIPLSSFFLKWSQPGFIPLDLHSLVLTDCLTASDIPFLIQWLARLPSLLYLTIEDNYIHFSDGTTAEDNIFRALASPHGADAESGGWLCPSLYHLRVDGDLYVADLIPLARARL